jgi:PhnB protein
MTTSQVKPIPDGMRSVTPYLTCAGASDAIAFYTKAFGATELLRLPGAEGKVMHAQIKIGDSVVMLGEECPEMNALGPKARQGTSVTIHLYVNDVDAAFAKAAAAGATVKMPVQDMFWGDRYGVLEDPFGHQWSLATHMRDVGPEEMQEAMQKMSKEMSQGQG